MSGTELTTISHDAVSELTIDKSRFVCRVKRVESADSAYQYIRHIREEHHDATHNVPAYRIWRGGAIDAYYSDDGEPAKSAGFPLYHIFETKNLVNIVAVVTRYFGGTKLGVGGLVRAYTDSLNRALTVAGVIPFVRLVFLTFETGFAIMKRIDTICFEAGAVDIEKTFGDRVRFKVSVPVGTEKAVMAHLGEYAIVCKVESDTGWK